MIEAAAVYLLTVGKLRGEQDQLLLRAVREGSVSGLSPWLLDGHFHVHMALSPYAYLCV